MSTKLIVGISGDSIAGPVNCWPYQALGVTSVGDASTPLMQRQCTYYSGQMILRNMAITGGRLNGGDGAVSVLRPLYVDILYAHAGFAGSGASPRKSLYINAIGTNDGVLSTFGTVAAYADAVALDIAAAKTAGATYGYIVSILPRADIGGPMIEANRLIYNALVTNAAWRLARNVDDCIDLASDSIMGNPANLTNATYYNADLIHPTTAGQARLAVIAIAKLNALVASL